MTTNFQRAATLLVLASLASCPALSAEGRPAKKPSAAGEASSKPVVVEGVDGDMVVVRPPAVAERVTNALARQTTQISDGAEVVTFPWAANRVFTIAIRPAMFTTINFPRDESVQQFAVSDPAAVNLSVNQATNTAMVKLLKPQAVTATAVTSKRSYFMRVVPALDGPWSMGVYWSFDDASTATAPFGSFANLAASTAPGLPSAQAGFGPVGPGVGIAPSQSADGGEPNFGYQIQGSANFRPVAVWDNGRFTWIQFGAALQELPAVFAVHPRNGLQIVNYTVSAGGTQILVNRLMPEFVLKLGDEEVRVTAKGRS